MQHRTRRGAAETRLGDHKPLMPVGNGLLRAVVALTGVAIALRLFFPPAPIESAAVLIAWLGLGVGIGLAVGRWWVVLLVSLPWPGIWYSRATGPEYLSRPNDFPAWLEIALLALPGFIGLAVGVGVRRTLADNVAERWPAPARLAERLALVAVVLAALGGAALDLGLGGSVLRPIRPHEVRRYSASEIRAIATGLAFPVYSASPDEGTPTTALRFMSAPPGLGPTEIFTLVYCDDRCRQSSEVQIQSAPPRYGPAARQRGGTVDKPEPIQPVESVEIAGVTWQIAGESPHVGEVRADALLDDAYVRISAPDFAHFARVAAGLRRIAP